MRRPENSGSTGATSLIVYAAAICGWANPLMHLLGCADVEGRDE